MTEPIPTREALHWYEAGLEHGIALGRRQAEQEQGEAWQPVREHVARIASQPSWAELCRRRGEHARADRATVQAARLGVSA